MGSLLNTTYILLHSYPMYEGAMIGALLQYINCSWYVITMTQEQA